MNENDVVIPQWALERWLPREPCRGCGKIVRPVLVHLPNITIGDVVDNLSIIGECVPCHRFVPAQVQIPRLELGYILATHCESLLRLRFGARTRFAVVNAGTGGDMERVHAEYQSLLQRTIAAGKEILPTDEWAKLKNDTKAMNDFLRRMGMLESDSPPPDPGSLPF